MLFTTETGSIYEVNTSDSCVRRVTNTLGAPATPLQGNNNWRTYKQISEIKIGCEVLILWDRKSVSKVPGVEEYSNPSTLTSRVVEINQ